MSTYGAPVSWEPATPRLGLVRTLVAWVVAAASVAVAAWLVPGVALEATGAAFLVAAVIAVLNAVLPPILAALRLPFMLALGFLLVLVADALLLLLADAVLSDDIRVDSFGDALLASLVIAAVSVVLAGDPRHQRRRRVLAAGHAADRRGARARIARTDVPGILFLEIDGLALPVLRDAMRDGSAPTMARWIAEDGYRLAEWETDLSSQTGASQAGILLGSNEDIPAFRWVEKETGRMMVCSSPADCAEIERRHATGVGLLVDGGASRGNLLSGEAEEIDPHRQPHRGREAGEPRLPGVPRQRLQRHARARPVRLGGRARADRGGAREAPRRPPARAPRRHLSADARRDVRDRPRPDRLRRAHRHDARAAPPCTRRSRATTRSPTTRGSSAPTRWRRCASSTSSSAASSARAGTRRGRTRSSCSPTTARRRARRSSSATATGSTSSSSARSTTGRSPAIAGRRRAERDGPARRRRGDRAQEGKKRAEERRVGPRGRGARLGQPRARLPDGGAAPAHARGDRASATRGSSRRCASTRTSAGCSCARPSTARSCSGPRGARYLDEGRVEGEDPLAPFSPTAAQHLLRTDGFAHVADIMVGSFYDPMLDEGCAFEELISFHGGLGGPQTRPFILAPPRLAAAGRADHRRRRRARPARGLAPGAAAAADAPTARRRSRPPPLRRPEPERPRGPAASARRTPPGRGRRTP